MRLQKLSRKLIQKKLDLHLTNVMSDFCTLLAHIDKASLRELQIRHKRETDDQPTSQHGILRLIPNRSPQSLLNLKSMCEELVNFSLCWIEMFCELWVQIKIFIKTPTPELQMKKTKFD